MSYNSHVQKRLRSRTTRYGGFAVMASLALAITAWTPAASGSAVPVTTRGLASSVSAAGRVQLATSAGHSRRLAETRGHSSRSELNPNAGNPPGTRAPIQTWKDPPSNPNADNPPGTRAPTQTF